MSEGINLIDEMARMIVMIGIPFPSLVDPLVEAKRTYLDRIAHEKQEKVKNGILTGKRWYKLAAIRSINQAIGRAIRHKYDYGAILLLDERYAENEFKGKISGWMAQEMKVTKDSSETISPLITFYQNASLFCANYRPVKKIISSINNDSKKMEKRALEAKKSTLDFKNVVIEKSKRGYVSMDKTKRVKISRLTNLAKTEKEEMNIPEEADLAIS